MMNKHIGKSYDKVDSKGILSGKPSYTGDFVPKDALVITYCPAVHRSRWPQQVFAGI